MAAGATLSILSRIDGMQLDVIPRMDFHRAHDAIMAAIAIALLVAGFTALGFKLGKGGVSRCPIVAVIHLARLRNQLFPIEGKPHLVIMGFLMAEGAICFLFLRRFSRMAA